MTEFIDTVLFLNDRLAHKPHLEYSRTATRRVRRCWHEGDPLEPVVRCGDVYEDFLEKYSDYANVKSAEVVEIQDLIFLKERIKQFPERVRMQRQQFYNCDNLTPNISISMSVAAQSGHTVTFSRTLLTTQTIGANFNFSGVFGSGGTSISFSRQVNVSNGNSVQETQTVTRSISASVPIPSNTAGIATLLVYETEVEVPFEAKVVIDGPLTKNESGFDRASDLLSAEERTTIIEGVLRVQGVSDGVFRTEILPGFCSSDDNTDFPTELHQTFEFFADGLPERVKSSEVGLQKSFEQGGFFVSNVDLYRTDKQSGDKRAVIGPIPDGISYTVIYIRNSMKPDPICGFNDLGVPNNATYLVEGRQYIHYLNGSPINSWFEEHEIQTGCFAP